MSGTARAERGSASLRSLRKEYGSVVAVKDVSLDVRAGEFLTLLGPSGSGKTTTLMMVAGFIAPTSGDILVDGISVTDVPPERRNIGVVFQNYALFPHMSVRRNLAFPLQMRGMAHAEIDRRVREVLDVVRLEGLEDRFPSQLSGGQQQRVALARAVVFDPPLLLMDEPLGALDKKLREHLQLELKHLQRRLGVTVIYVTHDQNEALTMSDRIAVMNHGLIEQIGSPSAVYEEPATPFVADFLGESNTLHGSIVGHDAAVSIVRTEHDGEIRCRRTPILAGTAVVVVIRPEKISLSPADSTDVLATGRVTEAIYGGDVTRYWVEATKIGLISIKAPSGADAVHPSSGDRVGLRWRLEDVRVYPA